MANLLRSNLKRMIKHPALWTCVALQIILTFIMTIKAKASPDFHFRLDAVFGMSVTFWGMAYSEIMVFVMGSLILGGDYQNNTLRNKLIIGYSRESLFFSQFLTLLTASFIMFFARLLVFCVFSLPLLKTFAFRSEYLWAVFFISLFSMVMYSAFVTFVISLSQSVTKTLVICISLFLIMMFLFVGGFIPPKYNESDYLTHAIVSQDNYYCSDWATGCNIEHAGFYKFMFDFFPSGHAIQIWDEKPLCLWRILLYLGLQTVALLTGGALIFKFRNLK